MHLGRHRHGAASISDGFRTNLIIWARSSSLRALNARGSNTTPEPGPNPDEICVGPHDRWSSEQIQSIVDSVIMKPSNYLVK